MPSFSGGIRGGGALGASAPTAESIVKKILAYLFPSQWTIGTFLSQCVFCEPVLKAAPKRLKQLLIVRPSHKIKFSQSV